MSKWCVLHMAENLFTEGHSAKNSDHWRDLGSLVWKCLCAQDCLPSSAHKDSFILPQRGTQRFHLHFTCNVHSGLVSQRERYSSAHTFLTGVEPSSHHDLKSVEKGRTVLIFSFKIVCWIECISTRITANLQQILMQHWNAFLQCVDGFLLSSHTWAVCQGHCCIF